MEFGVFAQLFVPRFERERDPLAEHHRIFRNVEIAKAADQHGFKYVWCPQHHFLDEYSHMPGPEAFLAFCAAQTERVHLGSAIFNITPPVNHPDRVAERVAMIDHLSEGRFEFGMGRGSSSTEQRGFGITDPELTKEMFDEVVPEFARMWRDEPYAYEGRFFSMPERNILPKPYTKPHPPMWVAAGNPGTFEKAARMGLGVLCFTSGSPAQLAPLIEIYKKTIETAEPVGDYVNDNIMGVTNMLCMEDRKKAFEVASNMGMNYYSTLAYHWLDNVPRPKHLPPWPERIPEPTPEQVEQLSAEGYAVIGDPDDCARSVQNWIDMGFDQLTFSPTTNTLPTEVVVGSMEVFGREVIPRFDRDPEHSTTRYRRLAAAALGH